ncbi:peroxisomal membrane anchor protein conserved region-domain-containing protein [Fennellomyces sp. T-0311]|nr:peroxisomal membrane anchor protein conserved region-domain-containing protein [Fennellomyces sp. T-0311]
MTNDNNGSDNNPSPSSTPKEQSEALPSQPPTSSEQPTKQVPLNAEPATPAPLREDLLKSAVSFLSSPNVRSADTAKKVAFLRQKGLSADEITEAFKRVGENAPATTTSQAVAARPVSAPVPPTVSRPAVPPRPPQVVYYPPAPPPVMPIQQLLGIALLAGFGLVGISAAVFRIVKRFIGPIFDSIARYQGDRYNQRTALLSTLNEKLTGLKPADSNKQLVEKHQTLSDRMARVVELAEQRVKALNDEPYSDFRDKVTELKDAISHPDYIYSSFSQFNSYSYNPGRFNNSTESPAVQSFKSEIRSFKGMLLNRRNFPSANVGGSRPSSPVTPAAPVRDVPNYHPRRRESFRAELNNSGSSTSSPANTTAPQSQ